MEQKELDALKEEAKSARKEADALKRSVRNRGTMLIVMLVVIAAIGFMYFMARSENSRLQRENTRLQNELVSRREQRKIQEQLDGILSALRADKTAGKFQNSLVYADYMNSLNDSNGVKLMGSSPLPLSFARDYELEFADTEGLKSALKSLYAGEFDVRSDMRFIFESNSSDWEDRIKNAAFFSLNNLQAGTGSSINKLGTEILNKPVLRFFFSTNHEGLYVVATVRDNKVSCYLASNMTAINRSKFINNINDNIKSEFDGEIQISLWEADSRLENEIDFDACIDIFINQLLERSK